MGKEEEGRDSKGEQERDQGNTQTETDREAETEAYTLPNASEMQRGHQVESTSRAEADLVQGLLAGTEEALPVCVFSLMGLIMDRSNSLSLPPMPHP